MSSTLVRFALACLLLAVSRDAWAGDAIDLDLRAPAECPRRDVVAAWVATEARGLPIAKKTLHLEITAAPYEGTLRVGDDDGQSSARVLRGATCEDVARALSVIGALALRDIARHEGDSAEAASAVEVVGPREPIAGEDRPHSTAKNDRSEGIRLHVGATFDIGDGLASEGKGLFGGSAFLDVGELRGPSVRASVGALDQVVHGSLTNVHERRYLGSAEGCSPALGPERAHVRGCVGITAGMRELVPSGIYDVQTWGKTVPWLAAVAMARARVGLTSAFFVDVGGGIQVAVTRNTLTLDTSEMVYVTPPIGAVASLGLGVRAF